MKESLNDLLIRAKELNHALMWHADEDRLRVIAEVADGICLKCGDIGGVMCPCTRDE